MYAVIKYSGKYEESMKVLHVYDSKKYAIDVAKRYAEEYAEKCEEKVLVLDDDTKYIVGNGTDCIIYTATNLPELEKIENKLQNNILPPSPLSLAFIKELVGNNDLPWIYK